MLLKLWKAESSIKTLHCTKENILSWVWDFFFFVSFLFFCFEKIKYKIDWTTLVHTDNAKM